MRDDNVDSYMAVFDFQLCNQQTDFGYIPAVIINAFSIYLSVHACIWSHACVSRGWSRRVSNDMRGDDKEDSDVSG